MKTMTYTCVNNQYMQQANREKFHT